MSELGIIQHKGDILCEYSIQKIQGKEIWLQPPSSLEEEHELIKRVMLSGDMWKVYKGYTFYLEYGQKDEKNYIKIMSLHHLQKSEDYLIHSYEDFINPEISRIYKVGWHSKESYIRLRKNKYFVPFSPEHYWGDICIGDDDIPECLLQSSDKVITSTERKKYEYFSKDPLNEFIIIFGIVFSFLFNGGWLIWVLIAPYIIYGIKKELDIVDKYGPHDK